MPAATLRLPPAPPRVRRALVAAGAALATLAGTASAQSPATAVPPNGGPAWASVQQALGGKGTMQPGAVLKFGFPRSDLQVTADGVALKPALALGSWVAFKRMGSGASARTMVMGDLVLTEDEVGAVMLALQQHGVEQTALHNHLLHESPRVMYVHVMAHGDAAKIAADIRNALGESRTPMPALGASSDPMPSNRAAAAPIELDTAGVVRALGASGKVNGGVFQVSVPRAAKVTDHGMEVPPSMGVATAINFQPTGGGKAAISGDFVMTADEVNPVIRALREHGIQVTALHSHMLAESPRLFFMHFWANDDALTLAGGLRAALDRMRVQRTLAKE
jgi:Domain of Unknown Function (DUF1259)